MGLDRSPNNDPNIVCTVCNESFSENQECLLIAACNHKFHRICIEEHLSNSSECPTCKIHFDLSELRTCNSQSQLVHTQQLPIQDSQTEHNSIPLETNKNVTQNQKHKNSFRGKPRGAMAKHYNLRSASRNLFQDPNQMAQSDLSLPQSFNIGSEQLLDIRTPTPSRNTNRITAEQLRQAMPVNMNTTITSEYEKFNLMLEASLPRILENLNINLNSRNTEGSSSNQAYLPPQNSTNNMPNAHASSISRSNSSHTNFALRADRITSIIQNWNLKFDGSTHGLNVEEFLYRVRTLTAHDFDNDYSIICKNLHILLKDKALQWFWRYHKQVQNIVWDDFCAAIRYQYKDFKTDSDIGEELRNRKQKPGESFESFYESICSILDRMSTPLPEHQVMEMVNRNLRPEIRHELLYVPLYSLAHLRKLMQMRENLFVDDTCRRVQPPKPTNNPYSRRIVSEVEFENDDITENASMVDAVAQPTTSAICWNCDQPGHLWEDCMMDRSVFCYGCGAKKTYKPSCPKCSTKRLISSKNSFTQNHLMKKP